MNSKLRFFRFIPIVLLLLVTTSQVIAQGPTGLVPQSLLVGGSSAAGPFPSVEPTITTAPPVGLSAPSSSTSTSATRQWINGTMTQHEDYRSCFPEGPQILTSEYVGYWGTTDASYPKVGDVYYGHVVVGVVGSSCAGGADVAIKILLPAHTSFYGTGGTVGVKCYFGKIGETLGDVTSDPDAFCTQHPTDAGSGWWDMGLRIVANGRMFEMIFPIYSTQPLAGMAGIGTQLVADVSETVDLTHLTAPYQWVTVTANPVTITYPTPSYTIIPDTTIPGQIDVKTLGNLAAHFASGNVYFDLGDTTAYGVTSPPFNVDGSGDTWNVWAGWTGFTVGQTYHWRMRFVPTSGTTVNGADQSFVFTGTPTAQTYTLTTSASPPNGGNVTLSPPGGTYSPGAVVSATATANSGYKFNDWTLNGQPGGTANPLSITMSNYSSVVANFMPMGSATITYHLYLPLVLR